MKKSYKYRLYPTQVQTRKIEHTLRLCCDLYNACLEQRRYAYQHGKIFINAAMQKHEVVMMKKELSEFKGVYSQVLAEVVWRVEGAYSRFFRRVRLKSGRAGYPRFHSYRRYDSFIYDGGNGFKIIGSRLHLSKIGNIRINIHRAIEGTIKTCRIKREVGEWYAIFTCEIPEAAARISQSEIGIDVGLESFLATSDGKFVENPRFLQKSLKKLRRAQRSLSRKKRGSIRRNKQRIHLAKLHRTISRQRKDFHHKVAVSLVSQYDMIAIEQLNIGGMIKSHHFARGILDVGWMSFTDILSSKAEWAGKRVIRVAPYNTSQVCSGCGSITPKDLSVRQHDCSDCGLSLHRDVNAARNILLKSRMVRTDRQTLNEPIGTFV